jgi:hypothetical protein
VSKLEDVHSVTIEYKNGSRHAYTDRIVAERVMTHDAPPGSLPSKANIEYINIRINLGKDSRA